jgi:hypothetical protein
MQRDLPFDSVTNFIQQSLSFCRTSAFLVYFPAAVLRFFWRWRALGIGEVQRLL